MGVKTLEKLLRELKLSTAANEIDETLRESSDNATFGWITNLLQREVDSRKEKRLQSRIRRSKIPELKSLEQFDWKFNPRINKDRIEDIATLGLAFYKRKWDSSFPWSTGYRKKSHSFINRS